MAVILSSCSSRERPELCKRMIDSFLKTIACDTFLFVYVDEEDPKALDYYSLSAEYGDGIEFEFGPHKTLIEVLNRGPEKYPVMDYYHEVNDDHVFRTHGWDYDLSVAIGERLGISYPKLEHLPSSIMMSGDLVRRLGYFAYPAFTHSWVDNFFKELGEALGHMVEVPEVWIEHCHWSFGKSEIDANYKKVIDEQNNKNNIDAYEKWKQEKHAIIERVLNGSR